MQRRRNGHGDAALKDGDCFNWLKYGEKLLRDRRTLRHYYRCSSKTDTGCPAKKMVDVVGGTGARSLHFRDCHNHPSPRIRMHQQEELRTEMRCLDESESRDPHSAPGALLQEPLPSASLLQRPVGELSAPAGQAPDSLIQGGLESFSHSLHAPAGSGVSAELAALVLRAAIKAQRKADGGSAFSLENLVGLLVAQSSKSSAPAPLSTGENSSGSPRALGCASALGARITPPPMPSSCAGTQGVQSHSQAARSQPSPLEGPALEPHILSLLSAAPSLSGIPPGSSSGPALQRPHALAAGPNSQAGRQLLETLAPKPIPGGSSGSTPSPMAAQQISNAECSAFRKVPQSEEASHVTDEESEASSAAEAAEPHKKRGHGAGSISLQRFADGGRGKRPCWLSVGLSCS